MERRASLWAYHPMDLDTLAELDELMQYWTKHISRQWSQACFTFEHGGRTLGIGVGSCISHAHLQILPLASDPMSNASRFLELPTLVDAFLCAANSQYPLFGDKGSWQVSKDQR